MGYSTKEQIAQFLEQAGTNPLFVCDMDGNVMTGYSLAEGRRLKLGEGDDPEKQSIPFGLPLYDIEMFADQGTLVRGIFAEKRMDARLPIDMVAMVNSNIANNQPYRLAFLTSRGADDTRRILHESGVSDVDKVTLVADSGATLFINGKRKELRPLTEPESKHLDVSAYASELQLRIEGLVTKYVPDYKGEIPLLAVERKAIASNIHYRGILKAAGQPENSPLDLAIKSYLVESLKAYNLNGPTDKKGASPFMLLEGPMTVELKIAEINKGLGLAKIMEAMLKAPAHQRPSSVVFTGDDVANGAGPGTDYFAMAQSRALGNKHGIPTYNIHTHHPAENDLNGHQPDAHKSADGLSVKWPKPPIDLTVRTPTELVAVISRADDIRRLWESEGPGLGQHLRQS